MESQSSKRRDCSRIGRQARRGRFDKDRCLRTSLALRSRIGIFEAIVQFLERAVKPDNIKPEFTGFLLAGGISTFVYSAVGSYGGDFALYLTVHFRRMG